jgi:hypothetical protein
VPAGLFSTDLPELAVFETQEKDVNGGLVAESQKASPITVLDPEFERPLLRRTQISERAGDLSSSKSGCVVRRW